MKKIVVALIICLVSFWLGYWTNEMKQFADGVAEDFNRAKNAKPLDLKAAMTKENFDEFIYKFVADSSFQLDRIKFPLRSGRLSVPPDNESFPGPDSVLVLIERTDWKVKRLFAGEQYKVQIYDSFKKEMRDTDERLFSWEHIYNGVNNGNNIECKFNRLDGLWYLTEYNDFSD